MLDWETKELALLLACDPAGAVSCGMLWLLFEMKFIGVTAMAAFVDEADPNIIRLVVPCGLEVGKTEVYVAECACRIVLSLRSA